MPIISDIAYGIENVGNEGLYALIELMSELNWDPIDATEHDRLINNLEIFFLYLYNNKNNLGENEARVNSHAIVHQKLYEAMKFSLDSVPGIDFFEDLLERTDDKTKAVGFNNRLKLILAQRPEGLRKLLTLYSEMYHIEGESKKTLVPPDDPTVKNILLESKADGYDDDYRNQKQFFKYMPDKKYRDILNKDLLKSESQRLILAEMILDKTKKVYFDKFTEKLNDFAVKKAIEIGFEDNYVMIMRQVGLIVHNHENLSIVSKALDELANIPIVKRSSDVRAFLAEQLSFRAGVYDDPADVLKLYDESHSLVSFKPDLTKSVSDKIRLDFMAEIKTDFSKRVYKHDGLIETYVPISVYGIKTNDKSIKELFFAYDSEGNLKIPQGPVNLVFNSPNGRNILNSILNSIIAEDEGNVLKPPVGVEDFFEFDIDGNIVNFNEIFKKSFLDNDYNLDQLLLYVKLINVVGANLNTIEAFNDLSLERRLEKLIKDFYSRGSADHLYRILSSSSQTSLNFDLAFERGDDGSILAIKDEFWKNYPSKRSKVNLFLQLLLADKSYSYYDLMKDVYQYQEIKTRATIEYQSLRHQFSMFKEKNLFRNGIETRQHVPAADEFYDLQVGDTQGSNISLTQVGDIATAYATQGDPTYSWIMITEPQKAINCSQYMEGSAERLPAQEFSTGVLKSRSFLGAIKIRKVAPGEKGCSTDPSRSVYTIVDGFVSDTVLNQFSKYPEDSLDKIAKLYGLEGLSALYLSRAILYSKSETEGGQATLLLEKMQDSLYFNYDASNSAVESDRVRTPYQEKFDDPAVRRESIYSNNLEKKEAFNELRRSENKHYTLVDPKKLREYHRRQKQEITKTIYEDGVLGDKRTNRLRDEKKQRESDKNLSEEMIRYTNTSELELDAKTKEYADSIYSRTALEKVPVAPEFFPSTATFDDYLEYLNRALQADDIFLEGNFKNARFKTKYAVEKLYQLDRAKADEALARMISEYFESSKNSSFRRPIVATIVSTIRDRNQDFINSPLLSKPVKSAMSHSIASDTMFQNYYTKRGDDEFLEKFEWAFEFIDTSNLLTLMNNPNSDRHSTPWRLYQSDMGNDRQLHNWMRVAEMNYDISLDGLNKVFEDLTSGEKLPHTATGGDIIEKIRNYPITAGGGLTRQGELVPGHIMTDKSVCTQFFRIDEQQLNELKSNEFITVIDYAACPENGVYGADYVIKYRYPNMQDCERLANKYDIDPQLVAEVKSIMSETVPEAIALALWNHDGPPLKLSDLDDEQFAELTTGFREYGELINAYERSLSNPFAFPKEGERTDVIAIKAEYERKYKSFESEMAKNTAFQNLFKRVESANQNFLLNLADKVINDKSLSAIERYRKLVSIHFFTDFNGRGMRMFYRQEAKRALYMFNWDFDITMPSGQHAGQIGNTMNDFTDHEFTKFLNMKQALHQEFSRSKMLGKVPDYYHVAEFWMAAFDINPKYYSDQEKNIFGKRLREFYMTDEVQRSVEKKAYYDYMHHIMQFTYSLDNFQILSHEDTNKNSSIHLACMNRFSPDCLNNLLRLADRQNINLVDLKNNRNENPAHAAARRLNITALSLLLNHAPSLFNAQDQEGKTPYNVLMENIYQLANDDLISVKIITDLTKLTKAFNTSQYDISEYRFENNQTLAHVLARQGNVKALKRLVEEFPSFKNKVDNQNKLPYDCLPQSVLNQRNKRPNKSLFHQFDSRTTGKRSRDKDISSDRRTKRGRPRKPGE